MEIILLAKEIIKNARYTLSDLSADRWSDERLLELLNDGLSDISINTILLRETLLYPIADGVVDIDLSTLVTRVTRVEYLDKPLLFKSFDEMDREKPEWQLEEGTIPKAIVYDEQKTGLYKLYPIVSTAYNPYIEYNSLFGIVTEISYSDIAPIVANTIGDISGVTQAGMLKFYFVRTHPKVTDINQDVAIDNITRKMLVHFIAGFAFRDNQDSQNRALANEELGYYSTMTDMYSAKRAMNTTTVEREVAYNPMGTR